MVQEIVKTALLGTDRYQPNLSLDFTDLLQKIADTETDKEAVFLKQTASFFILRSVSYPVIQIDVTTAQLTDNETYISETGQAVLQAALTEDNTHLLKYCFYTFEKNKQTIVPFLVPDVLDKYSSSKDKSQVYKLCGSVGHRILQLQNTTEQEELENNIAWDIADFAEIKTWVGQIRNTDPQAIWDVVEGETQSRLEEIISKEKVEKRIELLQLLQTGLSKTDEAPLLKQLKSKSGQVKAEVIRLLMQIEGSAVQNDFKELLQELITFENKKEFLGLKKTKTFTLVPEHKLTSTQKSYGLEEISSQKGIPDPLHHLYQCIERMPLSVIAQTFSTTEEEVIEQLYIGWKNQYLKNAFITHVEHFHNPLLIHQFVKSENRVDLLRVLPYSEALLGYQEALQKAPNNKEAQHVISYFVEWLIAQPYTEIPLPTAELILKTLKKAPYYIQGKQYYQLGLYLPQTIKTWLQTEVNRVLNDKENDYFQQQLQLTLKAIDDKNLLNQ